MSMAISPFGGIFIIITPSAWKIYRHLVKTRQNLSRLFRFDPGSGQNFVALNLKYAHFSFKMAK
jgi:hypothetical protein